MTEPVYIFVDVEAAHVMTEFGAVHGETRETFHGRLYESVPNPVKPAVPIVGEPIATAHDEAVRFADWLITVCGSRRPVFVSDNPAYDFHWIAIMFRDAKLVNPFGHSARRISDFWAGLQGDWSKTQGWKKFRVTPHDHNPVNDAMGNLEAFEKIMQIAKEKRNAV